MGGWEDGRMGRWEDGKMGRWEDGNSQLRILLSSHLPTFPTRFAAPYHSASFCAIDPTSRSFCGGDTRRLRRCPPPETVGGDFEGQHYAGHGYQARPGRRVFDRGTDDRSALLWPGGGGFRDHPRGETHAGRPHRWQSHWLGSGKLGEGGRRAQHPAGRPEIGGYAVPDSSPKDLVSLSQAVGSKVPSRRNGSSAAMISARDPSILRSRNSPTIRAKRYSYSSASY